MLKNLILAFNAMRFRTGENRITTKHQIGDTVSPISKISKKGNSIKDTGFSPSRVRSKGELKVDGLELN